MATNPTDVQITGIEIYFLPTTLRVPLKFGPETVTSVVCLRVRVRGCCGCRIWGSDELMRNDGLYR